MKLVIEFIDPLCVWYIHRSNQSLTEVTCERTTAINYKCNHMYPYEFIMLYCETIYIINAIVTFNPITFTKIEARKTIFWQKKD